MARRDEQGSTLSAHRAFVVHLGTGGRPGRRRFSGRVEHLSSGESMHFSSLEGLLAFFAAALDAAQPSRIHGIESHKEHRCPLSEAARQFTTYTRRSRP